ncbi:hypothetical protein CHUAL_014129 [Chamberlinius hualienensis]
MDSFTESFKFYKQGKKNGSLSSVIDLKLPDKFKDAVQLTDIRETSCFDQEFNVEEFGLIPEEKWKVYSLKNYEGCYIIENPFSNAGQMMWLRRSLEIYPQAPNANNIGITFSSENNPWSQLNETKGNEFRKSPLSKLHWVTLGYHHNWDTKVYDLDKVSEFPKDLKCLTQCVADRLGFKNYCPEAAIINYYSPRSSIGGHTDHSEFDHLAPLISISFGLTGLFLLGGATKDTEPSAMFLRSGDIMVMSGPSRLSYHAVPRILSEDCDRVLSVDSESGSLASENLLKYFKNFRINLNVRQVFESKNSSRSLLSKHEDNKR